MVARTPLFGGVGAVITARGIMQDRITLEDVVFDQSKAEQKQATLEKAIDELLKNPRGAQRWKAARDLAIKLNFSGTPGMSAQEENLLVIQQNKQDRELHLNKFGKSNDSNSDLRGALSMPYYVNMFVRLVDPQAFDKENIAKLVKAFPEYRIPDTF